MMKLQAQPIDRVFSNMPKGRWVTANDMAHRANVTADEAARSLRKLCEIGAVRSERLMAPYAMTYRRDK